MDDTKREIREYVRGQIANLEKLIRAEHVKTGATDAERQEHRDRLTAYHGMKKAHTNTLDFIRGVRITVDVETEAAWRERATAGGA